MEVQAQCLFVCYLTIFDQIGCCAAYIDSVADWLADISLYLSRYYLVGAICFWYDEFPVPVPLLSPENHSAGRQADMYCRRYAIGQARYPTPN